MRGRGRASRSARVTPPEALAGGQRVARRGRMVVARSSSPVLLVCLGRTERQARKEKKRCMTATYKIQLRLGTPANQPTTARLPRGAGEIGSLFGVETGKSTKSNEISRLGKTPSSWSPPPQPTTPSAPGGAGDRRPSPAELRPSLAEPHHSRRPLGPLCGNQISPQRPAQPDPKSPSVRPETAAARPSP